MYVYMFLYGKLYICIYIHTGGQSENVSAAAGEERERWGPGGGGETREREELREVLVVEAASPQLAVRPGTPTPYFLILFFLFFFFFFFEF